MHTYVVCKCGHVWKVSDCVGTCVLSFNYSAIFFTISSALIGLMTSHDLRFDTSSKQVVVYLLFFPSRNPCISPPVPHFHTMHNNTQMRDTPKRFQVVWHKLQPNNRKMER